MARIGTYEETEIPFLSQYREDHDVKGDCYYVQKVIACDSGLLLVLKNAPYNHFLFSNQKMTETLRKYLEESPKFPSIVPALQIKCLDEGGRKIDILSDSKCDCQIDERTSSSGNVIYHYCGEYGVTAQPK